MPIDRKLSLQGYHLDSVCIIWKFCVSLQPGQCPYHLEILFFLSLAHWSFSSQRMQTYGFRCCFPLVFFCIVLDISLPHLQVIRRHSSHKNVSTSSKEAGSCFQCKASIFPSHLRFLHAGLRHTGQVLQFLPFH